MSGKKTGGDKTKRDRMKQRNPRGNKRGGKLRSFKKQSPTARFLSINKGKFGDFHKIRIVN